MKTGPKQNRKTGLSPVAPESHEGGLPRRSVAKAGPVPIFSVVGPSPEIQPDRMLKRFRLPTSVLRRSSPPSNHSTQIACLATHLIRAAFHSVAPSPSESTQKISVRTTDRGLRTRSVGLRTTDYELRTTNYGLSRLLSFCIGFVVKPSHQRSSRVKPTKKDFCRRAILESDLRPPNSGPQHATRNTQHATRNTQHATRNTQHAQSIYPKIPHPSRGGKLCPVAPSRALKKIFLLCDI